MYQKHARFQTYSTYNRWSLRAKHMGKIPTTPIIDHIMMPAHVLYNMDIHKNANMT